jgi:hypothetical protein
MHAEIDIYGMSNLELFAYAYIDLFRMILIVELM